jgi:hypothetical protein
MLLLAQPARNAAAKNNAVRKDDFSQCIFDVTQASLQQASVLAKRTISTVLCPVPT